MKNRKLLLLNFKTYDSVNPRFFFAARLRAEMDFFFKRTLGFSKCSRFFTSDRVPAFSHDFLNRRNADSKLSLSLILTSATKSPGLSNG